MNLSVWLEWALADGVDITHGYPSSGRILSSTVFDYPPPVLAAATLRLNSSTETVTDGNHSVCYIPRTGDSYWLTFSGDFGYFPDQVKVFYSNRNGSTFDCLQEPVIPGDKTGSVQPTWIVCRTETLEQADTYFFTVEVGGQQSELGIDELIFPQVPQITRVTGCPSVAEMGTYDCETKGGDVITIAGSDLVVGMVALFSVIFFFFFKCNIY